MKETIFIWLGCVVFGLVPVWSAERVDVATIRLEDVREYREMSGEVRELLSYALELTRRGLGYQYGSCDPGAGGMDCSGAVHHILRHAGYAAPRQANTLYLWVKEAGNLRSVRAARAGDGGGLAGLELRRLEPGDLLFWEGTYNVGERHPPTSHVMIFVGHLEGSGDPVMVGASSGRYFGGKARHGVSVFDFALPRAGSSSKFVGYGPVPGLGEGRGGLLRMFQD